MQKLICSRREYTEWDNVKFTYYSFIDEEGQVVSLPDSDGDVDTQVDEDDVIRMIKSKEIEINNLELTADDKLVKKVIINGNKIYLDILDMEDLEGNIDLRFKSNVKDIEKYREQGYEIEELKDRLFRVKKDNKLWIVSDLQICLPENCNLMFSFLSLNHLDFKEVDSSEVKTTEDMFFYSEIAHLDLSDLNTSNIENMHSMFDYLQADTLDLSGLDTSKVKDMRFMFSDCSIKSGLHISGFNTTEVEKMSFMFSEFSVPELRLENFENTRLTEIRAMFQEAKIGKLELVNFNTSNVVDMEDLFESSKIDVLDIRCLDMTNVVEKKGMFKNASIKKMLAPTDVIIEDKSEPEGTDKEIKEEMMLYMTVK